MRTKNNNVKCNINFSINLFVVIFIYIFIYIFFPPFLSVCGEMRVLVRVPTDTALCYVYTGISVEYE